MASVMTFAITESARLELLDLCAIAQTPISSFPYVGGTVVGVGNLNLTEVLLVLKAHAGASAVMKGLRFLLQRLSLFLGSTFVLIKVPILKD